MNTSAHGMICLERPGGLIGAARNCVYGLYDAGNVYAWGNFIPS